MTTTNRTETLEDQIHTATMRIKREIAAELGIDDYAQVGVFIHPVRPETASVYVSPNIARFVRSGVVR